MLLPFNDNSNVTKKTSHGHRVRQRYVDIHCHCLPGIDDGPVTISDALALCCQLVDDCITEVIATPHQLGRFSNCNEAAHIREAVLLLNEELRSHNIALTVMPGGDVRVDERICKLLEDDKILTLADGGKYLLLELPQEVFIDIEPLLIELVSSGIQPIISHPERHPVLAKQPRILLKWLEHSAHLQVTSASLLGDFGLPAQTAAWHLLSTGWAALVATDSHDTAVRRPCMSAAFERISIELGPTIAQLVCIENPSRVLQGKDIAPAYFANTRKCINERIPSSS